MPTITYNGVNLAGEDVPFVLQEIEGLLALPAIESSDRSPLGRHGARFGSDWRRARTITVTLEVLSFDEATFHAAVGQLLAAFGDVGVTRPLVVTMVGLAGGSPVELEARVRNFEIPQDHSYAVWAATAVVQLVAADPTFRSLAEHTLTMTVTQAVAGRTYPRVGNRVYPSSPGAGTLAVVNGGTAPTYPRLRIFGPVVDPVVRNETTDRVISLSLSLAAGDYVDIDHHARTVVLNGQASRYSTLVSADFWPLEPGSNSLRYSALAPTASYLEVAWRDAWL